MITPRHAIPQFPNFQILVKWRDSTASQLEISSWKFYWNLMTHPRLKGLTFHPYLSPLTRDSATVHPKFTLFSQKTSQEQDCGFHIRSNSKKVSPSKLMKSQTKVCVVFIHGLLSSMKPKNLFSKFKFMDFFMNFMLGLFCFCWE